MDKWCFCHWQTKYSCVLAHYPLTGFIRGILRGVRYAKSLRVLFLHRRSPSWTTLVLYSRAVFIFNEPTIYVTIQIEKGHRINWLTDHSWYFCSLLHLKKAKTKVNLSGSTYSWVEYKRAEELVRRKKKTSLGGKPFSSYLNICPVWRCLEWNFIEPPSNAQQRRRRGERGTGVTKGS